MISSIAGVLVSPYAPFIGLVCFLVSGGLLVFRWKALPQALKIILAVLLVLSVLYLAFILWLVIGFGSNPGPGATPTPKPVP